MINHTRTLLINRLYTADAGSIYRPSEYTVRTSAKAIEPIRQILFGFDPDNLFVEYRAYQYMKLLHSSPLARFILDADTRLTYDYADGKQFEGVFGVTVDTMLDNVHVSGIDSADTKTGVSTKTWTVGVEPSDVARVRSHRPYREVLQPYAASFVLPGSTLRLYLPNTQGVIGITAKALPAGSLATTLKSAVSLVKGEAAAMMFRAAPAAVTTCWNDDTSLPDKAAAMLLGLALATEAAT